MPNMWEQTEELAKQHEMGSTWLKLANDKDSAVLVFLGEPYPREVCFVDGKYELFTPELKAAGFKPSLRIAINVALYGTREVKVLEQGMMFFKDLFKVREKYGLEKWCFEVQRNGAAKDPKTTYSILPEHQLTPEEQEQFQSLPLNDLERVYDPIEPTPPAAPEPTGTIGQLDPSFAHAMVVQLKVLPKVAVERFLTKFGVSRVKDLPAAQMEKARVFIEQLVSEFDAPAPTGVEVDPFA
jgi:hypothetical protein